MYCLHFLGLYRFNYNHFFYGSENHLKRPSTERVKLIFHVWFIVWGYCLEHVFSWITITNVLKNHPSDNPNYQEIATTNQDSERIRLKPPGTGGPKYTQQRNEVNETNELQVNTLHCK